MIALVGAHHEMLCARALTELAYNNSSTDANQLYAFVKIASITASIIALLDFISAGQYMIHCMYHFVH